MRLLGWEIKEPRIKKKGEDWVTKAAMAGIPVTIVKKEKHANN